MSNIIQLAARWWRHFVDERRSPYVRPHVRNGNSEVREGDALAYLRTAVLFSSSQQQRSVIVLDGSQVWNRSTECVIWLILVLSCTAEKNMLKRPQLLSARVKSTQWNDKFKQVQAGFIPSCAQSVNVCLIC